MTNFSDLHLCAPLLKALDAQGYATPTPIQEKAIPAVMTGTDLLGIAQTGTGKTAAFALPILHRLNDDPRPAPAKGCRVLVLSPTRELASQIADSFRSYGRNMRLSVTTVFGGVAPRPQIRTLARGVDILIATPGRLLDHMQSGHANLAKTEILVLDEADQMLDLGFVKPIRTIVANISSAHQTLFFSATMPREITKLAHEFLHNPAKVTVTPVSSTVERINQKIIFIEAAKKRALLGELLGQGQMPRCLIFTRTKRGADKVAKYLDARGVSVAAIHGNKSQRQREQALSAFRNGKIEVLVATDIAARGIDVDAVSHVVNFELPEVPEAYVHRIGRTARAGASGSAISLCDQEERHLLRAIERVTKQTIAKEDRRLDTALEVEKKEPRSRGAHQGRGRPGANGGRNGAGNGAGRSGQRSAPRGRAQGTPQRGRAGQNASANGGNNASFDPLHRRMEQMTGETGTSDTAAARPKRRKTSGQNANTTNNQRTERGQRTEQGQSAAAEQRQKRSGGKAGGGRSDNSRSASTSANAGRNRSRGPRKNRNNSGQRLQPA